MCAEKVWVYKYIYIYIRISLSRSLSHTQTHTNSPLVGYDNVTSHGIISHHMASHHTTQHIILLFASWIGTLQECRYNLMTFGIPCDVLPLGEDEQFDLTYHHQWLQQRRELEALQKKQQNARERGLPTSPQQQEEPEQSIMDSSGKVNHKDCSTGSRHRRRRPFQATHTKKQGTKSSPAVVGKVLLLQVPGPFDVICGRDMLAQNHRGNFRYQHFIERYWMKYETAEENDTKTEIANEVVRLVMEHGRFIKECEGGWMELSWKEARDKVSNAFRSRRKKMVKSQRHAKWLEQRRAESVDEGRGEVRVRQDENSSLGPSEASSAGLTRRDGDDGLDEGVIELKRPRFNV